jgi:hypothetical protein
MRAGLPKSGAAAALSLAQGGPFTSIQLKIMAVKVEGGQVPGTAFSGPGRFFLPRTVSKT